MVTLKVPQTFASRRVVECELIFRENFRMRERDMRACWQQILTLVGVGSIPEEEWENIFMDYHFSWDRQQFINLGNKKIVGAVARKGPGPSAVMKHRNSTAPGGAVASSHAKRRKTSPSPSPSPSPSTPVASPFKRRNSMAPPSTLTPRPFSKDQAWNSSICTPQALKDFKDFTPINPISPIESLDSVALDPEMNLKKSGSAVTRSAPKRRNTSVAASAKVKPKQKPISNVKDVKESPPKKPLGDIGVDPPVKRKREEEAREEEARRLEEEQALKMMNQTSNPTKLPPKKAQKPYDYSKELEKLSRILGSNKLATTPHKKLLELFLMKPVLEYNKTIAKINKAEKKLKEKLN